VQFRTRVLRPGLADVNVLAADGEAASGAVGSQVTHLHVTALVLGAHSGVDGCSHTRIHTTEEHRKIGKKIVSHFLRSARSLKVRAQRRSRSWLIDPIIP